jgi:hypothetical protein
MAVTFHLQLADVLRLAGGGELTVAVVVCGLRLARWN